MLDLGLISKIPTETAGKIKKIAGFDFTRVRARMCVDYPTAEDELDRLEKEVKRFLSLAVLEKTPHVTSSKVDALWHYFVLHTMEYRDFCLQIFGKYLEHVPILPEEKHKFTRGYMRTKQLYQKHFGTPPADLWRKNDQICWDFV